ncbi:STAS domain-containing protein [Yinghuangia sp. YIM S09857]|uniref:STAS domain-containing protein n=1 Tax=Yinghuangia sp. YIM S09857 TaxID=3436929 RepID=UPI003F52D817
MTPTTPLHARPRESEGKDYLTVHCAVMDGLALIVAAGEIDLDSAAGLRTAADTALRSDPAELHIDLSRITFCDSTGLHALVRAHRIAAQAGATVTVTASTQVRRLLELTGTAHLFPERTVPAAAAEPRP